MKYLFFLSLLIVVSLSAVQIASAQPTFGSFGDAQASGVAYHQFAAPGEATIEVMVLNSLGASGIYKIGDGTRIDKLLILAGASALPREPGQRREVIVELLREAGGQRTTVYEAPLEEFLAHPEAYPTLEDGDVLHVETVVHNTRINWRETVQIVSSLSTLTLLVVRLATGGL